MKKIITLLLPLLLLSCSKKKTFIYYNYNQITITRIDKGNEVFLYYGKYDDKDKLPYSYIKTTYTGFDGLSWGYIFFKEDKKIKIMPLEGNFDVINKNPNIEIIQNDDSNYINWHKKANRNYENVLEFRNIIKAEIKVNQINNSKISADYPK